MQSTQLANRRENYNFFAYIFMILPDTEFVDNISCLAFDQDFEDEPGVENINNYIKSSAIKTPEEILKELLIDRTQLLRAIRENGCPPPYESLYVKRTPQDVIGELILLYNQASYCLEDEVKESHEYIGTELNFMSMLCMKHMEAIEANNTNVAQDMELLQVQFFNEHLKLWIPKFAKEMHKASQTDFYKGIALMLGDWIQKESEYLSEQTRTY